MGTWYGVYPAGAKSALAAPYHASFKRGTSNNVLVRFSGGGVSVNPKTAANPDTRDFNTGDGHLTNLGAALLQVSPLERRSGRRGQS